MMFSCICDVLSLASYVRTLIGGNGSQLPSVAQLNHAYRRHCHCRAGIGTVSLTQYH